MKDMAATAKTTSRPTPKGDLPMTQIPYPHTPVEVGPYLFNSRLAEGRPYLERLSQLEVAVLERLVFLALKPYSTGLKSRMVRLDAVPTSAPGWRLDTLRDWTKPWKIDSWLRAAPRPGFEVELGPPDMVAPLEYFRLLASDGPTEPFDRFGTAARSLRIGSLFRTLSRDTELYAKAGEFLGVPVYDNWGLVPMGSRGVYASAPPSELPPPEWLKATRIRLSGDPFIGKRPAIPFFGGMVIKPEESVRMIEEWKSKGPPMVFRMLASVGGFFLKPLIGGCCQDSVYMRKSGGRSSGWKDLMEVLAWASREKHGLWLMPWHEPRATEFAGWGEIHRIYFLRHRNRFRVVGGLGTATPSGFGHGSTEAVVWPVLPPEGNRINRFQG